MRFTRRLRRRHRRRRRRRRRLRYDTTHSRIRTYRALLGRLPRAMDRPMTLGATLVSFGRWNARRQRGRGRVARATVDEDMNEDVSDRGKNGNKSRVVPLSSLSPSSSSSSASSMSFASAADEAAPRRSEQSSRMYDDTKRRSRWSGLWDEVELEVSERLWLSDLNSMLTPPWGQFLLSDGSMTVRGQRPENAVRLDALRGD
jgi:hypothetical protein